MSQASSSKTKLSESEIINQFNVMKQELTALATKIGELESEAEEHRLVIDTLKPMKGDRKCFRLVGGVLIEHNVQQVLPALQTNFNGIDTLMNNLVKAYKEKDDKFKNFQTEHNIRIKSSDSL